MGVVTLVDYVFSLLSQADKQNNNSSSNKNNNKNNDLPSLFLLLCFRPSHDMIMIGNLWLIASLLARERE